MTTFEDLYYARPGLAQAYLAELSGRLARPLALYGRRRVGKTAFLQQDLTPAAKDSGFTAIYVDFWTLREDPLATVEFELKDALDDARIPAGRIGKIAKTKVRRLGAVEFGESPSRNLDLDIREHRIATLLRELHRETGRPTLLMLDEVQQLAEIDAKQGQVATLRAIAQNPKNTVRLVMTGSSQAKLVELFTKAGSPMYGFARLDAFPTLDDGYVDLLLRHFKKKHPAKDLDRAELVNAFDSLGRRPVEMRTLVHWLAAEGSTQIAAFRRKMSQRKDLVEIWNQMLSRLTPLQLAVLVRIAREESLFTGKAIEALRVELNDSSVSVSKAQTAVKHLIRERVVLRIGDGAYSVEDVLFGEYLGLRNLAIIT